MKKLIATFVSLLVLSIAALPAAAQTRSRCANTRTVYNDRNDGRYDSNVYRDSSYRNDSYSNDAYRNDSYRNDTYSNDPYYNNGNGYSRTRAIWNQRRDKITTAGGAVGGAVLGGLIGGKKGAIIGAVTGGAGAAVYTYKVRDRYRRY
ncbi:MAG TPA: hypothetical protein DHU55_14095 [Blastocatellia bacterium]|jgi:hypothetical protein|nr:hypothetical protein [Blastocatellia bacterium]HCX30878.1 hypothetical protein [Blastocatellia bacterium]